MSLRLSRRFVVLATLGWLLSGTGFAADKPRRPIELSDPKSLEITTNLNQLTIKRGELRELEDNITKSFRPDFSDQGSLDGVIIPPVNANPGAARSKKEKEALDLKKNWFLMAPEDFTKMPTWKDLLKTHEYGPDGKDKKPRSAMETYFERQERKKRGDKESRDSSEDDDELTTARKRLDMLKDLDSEEEADAAKGLKKNDRIERGVFDLRPSNPVLDQDPARQGLSDFFGLGNSSTPSTYQMDSHRASMKEFEKLLPVSPIEGQSPLPSMFDPKNLLLPSIPSTPVLPPNAVPVESSPALGFVGSLAPISQPDLGVKSLNALGVGATTPRSEPPRIMQPSPTITAPKRPF